MSDPVVSISPALTLPPTMAGAPYAIEAYNLWVSIPANNDVGAIISGVLAGDTLIVYSASGIASFDSTSMKLVGAALGLANAIAGDVLMFATEGAAAPFVAAWNTAASTVIDAVGNADIKSKRRDPYGCDPGTGDYASHEGGLIVCMPECKGAIYASDDYYLGDDSKSKGRRYPDYSAAAKKRNVLYPCPVPGGLMSATASIAGAINILAFDSTFDDNAGSYNVGLCIVRGQRQSGRSVDELVAALQSAGPTQGGV
jgi:hypothetical protein